MNVSIKRYPGTEIPNEPSIPAWLERVLRNRGVTDLNEVDYTLSKLAPTDAIEHIQSAAEIVADVIQNDGIITIAGDYDCDGATGTAVLYRGLRMLGAKHVNYALPDRALDGYGLSVGLVSRMNPKPDLIITVDSGISSLDGVDYAKQQGIRVVVTDHHLAGETLPAADAIINPNAQPQNPLTGAAGVTVGFYLIRAVNHILMDKHDVDTKANIAELLDIVAIGTVADVVPLTYNNRLLVSVGIRRIRNGKTHPGILALLKAANVSPPDVNARDIGYAVAPLINAAGRLESIEIGVECLITDDPARAEALALKLKEINQNRKTVQAEMIAEAETIVKNIETPKGAGFLGCVLHNEQWHPGCIGLVAGMVKETHHVPVVVFAPANPNDPSELRGSARSISGIHIRDILALIDAQHPGCIMKFGGHAMAAGLSIHVDQLPLFTDAFEHVLRSTVNPQLYQRTVWSDGELPMGAIDLSTAELIEQYGPWGHGFSMPVFDGCFRVTHWRRQGTRHAKLELEDVRNRQRTEAFWFNCSTKELRSLPEHVHVAYEVGINRWFGRTNLQLTVVAVSPLT